MIAASRLTQCVATLHCAAQRFGLTLRSLVQQATATEQNAFLELFYERYVSQLIGVLAEACEPAKAGPSHAAGESKQDGTAAGKPDQASAPSRGAAPSALAIIADLLCFCVQHHSYRIKCALTFRPAQTPLVPSLSASSVRSCLGKPHLQFTSCAAPACGSTLRPCLPLLACHAPSHIRLYPG